jgi:thymidylate kinase
MSTRTTRIITFSGIDGAGKTTQIESISAELTRRGYRVARIAFWDDVAVFSKFRTRLSLRVLANDKASDSALRRDKNVRKWYLTLVRAVFYVLDTWKLRSVVARVQRESPDFVIFDRYVYDQLVQIRSQRFPARLYIRMLLVLAPTPDFGFIIDASPDEAFQRKPEYPLPFLYEYRRAFLNLRHFDPALIVVGPGQIEDIQRTVLRHILLESTSHERHTLCTSDTEPAPLSNSP